ncbi:SMP-30/gluconolactonase/LRE family protein [Aeromicrobium sp. CF3.5]|uniref:SMP-30/gluconolactonase/LRE family protein n=1 Tax=Aeromicrobium sp. CF3.5 TaxID=3373078 RepID=UPI003EE6478B
MSVLDGPWEVLSVGDSGWDLGEGLRSTEAGLVAVDLLAGRLYRVDLAARAVHQILQVDDVLGAVAAASGDHDWIAAIGTGVALVSGDEISWLGRPVEGGLPRRVNDAVCDPAGRFWFGTMAYDNAPGAGALHRLGPHGDVRTMLEDVTVPNGPAFVSDGSIMYLADSAAGTIYRILIGADGELGSATVFVQVPDGSPDGMIVDEAGCLWFAVWGAGQVWRVDPTGAVLDVLDLPASQPTSVSLHEGHVVVSTAAHGLPDPAAADGHLLVAPCSVGAPRACRYESLKDG